MKTHAKKKISIKLCKIKNSGKSTNKKLGFICYSWANTQFTVNKSEFILHLRHKLVLSLDAVSRHTEGIQVKIKQALVIKCLEV
jgi:hypothetical protein